MKLHKSQAKAAVTLCQESVSKRRLPANFNQDNLALFSRELERVIPQTSWLEFRDILVSSEGILFEGHRILPESFAFPSQLEQWKRRSVLKFLANNYLRRRRRFYGDVLWIVDHWSNGYFHWLTDALPRLFVVRERLDDLVLMLPWDYETRDLVQSSLKAFAVKSVEFIGRREVLQCRRLFMPTHTAPSGHYNEAIIRGVRGLLLNAYGDSRYQGPGEKIYISRSRARKRRIDNEEELVQTLRKFGFLIIYAEELSFEQQVQICSRARYLVSNHGAGLTNMLFMTEGASVLELRHHADRINNCYFTLSSALNLNYFYQICQPVNSGLDPHVADLLVEPKTLEENLRLMFER